MNIKKGDKVQIRSGKDRGKTGAVIHAFPQEGLVSVEGVNLYKKRSRPKKAGQKGEVVHVARPLPVSRVSLTCASCKKPVRPGFRTDGKVKARYCRTCGTTL